MLLSSAVLAGGASAQSLPSTDALPSGGAGVTTGPDGLKVEVGAGDSGGVTVGAGPGGVNIGLRGAPPVGTPPLGTPPVGTPATGGTPSESGSTPGGPAAATPKPGTSRPSRPAARDSGPGDPAAGGGRNGGRNARSGAGTEAGRDSDGSARGAVFEDLRRAARKDGDGKGGVAPVFDLVERIPAGVRAGLVALALIALAMWALWVRGRRRLEHNAYVEADTGVANMAAFEQVLEREWQRAARYRRPLGLLLFDVEQTGAGAIRLLGERDARAAVDDINQEIRESDMVARLAPSRFAVICPEAPQGSIETLAHAIELRLEERRLRCWAGLAERTDTDVHPADVVARAASALAELKAELKGPATVEQAYEPRGGREPVAFPEPSGRAAAA